MLPLHEGLIVATNREEFGVSLAEHNTDDMLGVTSEASGEATLSAGVAEQVDETVVVTGGQELLVVGASNGVDVGSVGARGVDTFGGPLELDGVGSPHGGGGVGTTGWILIARGDLEEEELVGTTVGAEVFGSGAPVQSHDVRVVSSARANERPVGGGVDVDVVIVGTDGEVGAVGGEGHNLNPLLGLAEEFGLGAGISTRPDRDTAVVGSDSKPVNAGGNSAGALGVWESREGGGTSLDVLDTVRNLDGLQVLAVSCVPHHDLVVITGSDDVTFVA
jgi:hypothetical protein